MLLLAKNLSWCLSEDRTITQMFHDPLVKLYDEVFSDMLKVV